MVRMDCCWVIPLSLFTLKILRPALGQEGSGTTPSPFEDCTGYPALPNSNAFTGETTHGSVLTVICNNGYINTGAEQYICFNGQWEPNGGGSEPYCAIQCDVPSLENGQTSLTDNGCSYEGCNIAFTCNTGYNLIGQQTLTCQASGSWGAVPTCQIVDCGAPTISNGAYTGGSTTYGSEVTFQCNQNSYSLVGSSTAICGADGSWIEQPSCVYDCGAFPNVENANLTFSCSGQQLEGCSVLVSCGIGYNAVGNVTVQCNAGQGWEFQPSCVISDSGTSYNVTLEIVAPEPEDREAFEQVIQQQLTEYYIEEMGETLVVAVVIINITYVPVSDPGRRKRQTNTRENAIIYYTVVVPDTTEAKGELSSAQAGLVTTESLQIAGKTVLPLRTTYSQLTLERTNGSAEAVEEASCRMYTLVYGACPEGSQCKVDRNGDYTSCEPVSKSDDDFGLKVGLGVGIPLFLLTCALIGVIAYYIYSSKTKRRRRKQFDFDDTDSAARSGFSPFAVPARLNPNGRRGPLYGSNMSDGWEDAASVGSDGELKDRYEKPYYVPVGYHSGPSKLASNYSWDFMYPHLDDRFAMPRPRI